MSNIKFKRKCTTELENWREKYSDKYAVLLEGPKRVGKTTIAKEFAQTHYKSYILLDFSKGGKEITEIFDDIRNLDMFFLRLQLITNTKLYEHESVIIFDEVQLFPKARQAIKHLVEDGRYNYIETGSLIGIRRNVENILIPSEEMKINVYPMDYEEFCWALGKDYNLLKDLNKLNKPIGQATNRNLMRDFRIYMAIGGMPQAVMAYIENKSFIEIDKIKREIIGLYLDDFKKIDKTGRISMIYNAIPASLVSKKNKFSLSGALNKRISNKDLNLLSDLVDSKTVLICYNTCESTVGLNQAKILDEFKLYLSDVGLFTTMLFNDKTLKTEDIYKKLISDKIDVNLVYLYENMMAQIIKSTNRELYYHIWKENDKCRYYEVDFLLSDGCKIVPIEVKSANYNNHKSILEFCKKYSQGISRRILFSPYDVSHIDMLELKPLYLSPVIISEFK